MKFLRNWVNSCLFITNKVLLLKTQLLVLICLSILFFNKTIVSQSLKGYHPECAACHNNAAPTKNSASFVKGREPSSICLDCHYYSSNHHPIDFVPEWPYSLRGLDSFPRFNGQIKCLTCHEVHGGPDLSETPKLLRNGPYNDKRKLCADCHDWGKFNIENPHLVSNIINDPQNLNEDPACLTCHYFNPDPEAERTEDVTFKADVSFLCWLCHPSMSGGFFNQHFLVKPSKKVLERIQRTERDMNVIIPLVPRGRITCATCHNPHAEGTISYEPASKGSSSKFKLRLQNICIACHDM